jgi:hypothetical protein
LVIAATTGRPLPAGAVSGTGPIRAFAEARLRLLTRLWVAAASATTDEEIARAAVAREQLHDLEIDLFGYAKPIPARAATEFLKALPTLKRLARSKGCRGGDAVGGTPRRTGPEPVRSPNPGSPTGRTE